ncbi:integral membrane protein [Phlyctema vagabunda]|uniref:Integral membrane protein n=1 Tax=Phlyctema vagabunda TaxID=108571 RepID=A0ABR4P8R8_9HELO
MSENIPIGLIQYSTRFFYLLALSTNKISVCLFCLKIFGDGRSRWLVIGTIGVVTAYTIPIFFLSTFTCYPIRKSWDPMVQGKCIDTLPIFYTLVVVNIVIDVWLIVLIARKVGQLHLPRKQKTLLLLIVTMGWIGVVAALFRAIRVTAIVHQVELGRDAPWIAFDTSIWSAVEVCVGLFCVSAPTIKPFIRQCMPHILTTLKSTFSRNYRETKTSPSHPLQSQKSGPRHNENSLEFSESPSLLREERSQGEHLLRDRDMG